MNDKSQISSGRDPLAHAPAVAIAPPARCFHRDGSSPGFPCGELARWERRGNHWFATQYFCDDHRAPSDVLIPDVHPFRRIRISCEVYMSAVHVNAPLAHTESIVRLEEALKGIGAILDVVNVGSNVVKSSGLPLPVPHAARRDNPE